MSLVQIDGISVVRGNFGECFFCDNLDPIHGMPSLSEKAFDEIITDPPYNIEAKITKGEHYNNRRNNNQSIDTYDDHILDYPAFSHRWFNEAKRIANYIMFTCGRMNKRMWYQMEDFKEMIWYIPNSPSRGYTSNFLYYEPILCYGNYGMHRVKSDVIKVNSLLGILLKKRRDLDVNHPHPKPLKLYDILIRESKPKSVLDCFAGSCRIGHIAERYGIKWRAYEINSRYIPLIQREIQAGMKEHQQTSLDFLIRKKK